jgi:DNA-binding CsgD family transcriptional regulator/tetratricopeptide (TPR) repeat protein
MPDLLERDSELSLLAESVEAVARSARGQLLLVGGEAGVGKTALVRRFCEQPGRRARILWGACDPLFTPRPLGPLLAVGEETGGRLEEVLARGAMPYEVVTALADELGRRSPSVFVLEDVHWADEATLDLLRLLARRVETVPALVVATYRDDELDASHPLRIVLGELATRRPVRRLKLVPLSAGAVSQLAEPYGVDAEALYGKTGGNAFFVVEALAAGAGGIPDTVRDAVLARAARLGPAGRAVLEAVAVVPPHAELRLLEALVDEPAAGLDECLASGMLGFEAGAVSFRHELARLAVEESVAPHRQLELHRKALAALAEPPAGAPDLARCAHHADAAGDAGAILRFAPAAGDRAASLGAYREAAAHYARALRFGDRLAPAERATLLERRSRACSVTDQHDEAIEAIRAAIECRRELGARLEEGDDLRRLSEILYCPGRNAEAAEVGREAVELLETLPPGRGLALAYANLADTCMHVSRGDEAIAWGERARALAERLGDAEIALHALGTIGTCELVEHGSGKLEEALALAQRSGYDVEAGRILALLGGAAAGNRRYDLAAGYLQPGVDFCGERGLERDRLYLLVYRARFELDRGLWSEAAESAEAVLRMPSSSITPRIWALVVLGLVRARRGDPGSRPLLDEAWALAEPPADLWRTGPVAAARAEAAWLEGEREAVLATTKAALRPVLDAQWGSLAGELADWRRRAGGDVETGLDVFEPYALQLAGEPVRAAELWEELGCPYEAALALADAGEEEPLRRSLDELQRLGARPAAAIVARRLRERGVRGLPRGPRPATRENPAGLTRRELEVLALLPGGLRNSEIAAKLVLSDRTVDHHVAAILRKLGVRTRAQASAEAVRLGLTSD